MTIDTIIREGINIRMPVRGSSMFPVLSTGDSIVVSPPDDLKKGDIILYRDKGNLVCHRIVKVVKRSVPQANDDGRVYYITRGDSLFYDDAPVSVDDIIGKVSVIERKRMSLPRRLLLTIYPLLRPRIINSIIIAVLVRAKQLARLGLPA
ncbi:MAG: signal peptidase I [Thermodesulfovibrionales bacterium]